MWGAEFCSFSAPAPLFVAYGEHLVTVRREIFSFRILIPFMEVTANSPFAPPASVMLLLYYGLCAMSPTSLLIIFWSRRNRVNLLGHTVSVIMGGHVTQHGEFIYLFFLWKGLGIGLNLAHFWGSCTHVSHPSDQRLGGNVLSKWYDAVLSNLSCDISTNDQLRL